MIEMPSKECRRCGAALHADAWLCECGADLREPDATVWERELERPKRSASRTLPILLAIPTCIVAGALIGAASGYSGSPGWFGSDFDAVVYAQLGAVCGALAGVVVVVVLVVSLSSGARRR
jgi:hypothetical protein